MKLMIRAHDLGVRGEENIVEKLKELSLDGVQLVAYKSIDGVSYRKGGIDDFSAKRIGDTLRASGFEVALVGAYFNPVHPNSEKAECGAEIFSEYLSVAKKLGCTAVGSETGSYMGDPWGYHPMNRTEEAEDRVVEVFGALADCAQKHGVNVAVEGAFNHVCYTPEVLNRVIRRIGRDNVLPIFDLYNYLDISNHDLAYDILGRGHELFGKNILLYHIKDFIVSDGKLIQCGVGKGVLDFERILGSVYNVNPDATLVFEGTVGEDIPYAVNHIKNIINKIQNK